MLPYGRQSIDEDDIAAVAEVLRGDFLTTGPKIAEFEAALCAATGAPHTVVCSNGTTALHLAAISADLGPGDAAIIPSVTFLATANAIRYTGADVVFADVDPQTGIMNADHLEEALRRCKNLKPKAVFPVHLKGDCADLTAIRKVSDKHNLKIITDACHALGGVYKGKPAGACAFEDMATFSFHPVKTIAAGEGGAVTTNSAEQATRMRRLRSHGMLATPANGPWSYDMPELGFNYRLTDIQCALGISQMKKLNKFIQRRRELAALYTKLLQPLAPHIQTPVSMPNSQSAWHLYSVRIDFTALGTTRAKVMNALRENGVGTQVHYIPVHSQPYYKGLYGDIALPGADQYYERTLSLPLFPAMTDKDVEFVVNALKNATGG